MLEKANRWVGRAASLIESEERFRIHLLLGQPHDERLHATFQKACKILQKMPGDPELVVESMADEFAAQVDREIGVHGGTGDPFELR